MINLSPHALDKATEGYRVYVTGNRLLSGWGTELSYPGLYLDNGVDWLTVKP